MKQAQEVVQRRNLISKRLTDVIRRRGEEPGDLTMKHVYNSIIYEGTEDEEVGGGGARGVVSLFMWLISRHVHTSVYGVREGGVEDLSGLITWLSLTSFGICEFNEPG